MIRRVHTFFFLFVFNCLAAIKDMIRRVRLARAESPYTQHALKGQKLLAQGNALGYHERKPVALYGQKLYISQRIFHFY